MGFEFNGFMYLPADEELNGCQVYHVKGYEDSDDICLVEQDGGYRLYCVE